MTNIRHVKTAIVIGATGLVGAEVTKQLAESEHVSRIVTITRRPIEHNSVKVENHVIDFAHLADFSHLFKADLLFSCLGTTAKQAGSIKAQSIVDLDYQFMAASLAAGCGVGHYLLVSSSGADSESLSPYMKMKGRLEEKVQALPFNHISIFQPSLLLGERREARFAEGVASVVLPMLCKLPGLRRYRPIHAQQVAQKMIMVSSQPKSAFERIQLDEMFAG